jgi:hypothetical protein
MTFSPELLARFETIYKSVGPLRYQMADADCVPTTVVNGLLFTTQKHLPPQLLRLIWSASLDQRSGTGWVCSQLLAEVLQAWFSLSQYDGAKKSLNTFQSFTRQDEQVSLKQNNSLVTTLNEGGVVCITVLKGGHYSLLHSHLGGKLFFGFDPTWPSARKRTKVLQLAEESFGMCNAVWTRDEILSELSHADNKFLHIIKPRRSDA